MSTCSSQEAHFANFGCRLKATMEDEHRVYQTRKRNAPYITVTLAISARRDIVVRRTP